MIVPVVGIELLGALVDTRARVRRCRRASARPPSLKLASASISLAERGFTRRANSSSDSTYGLCSPLIDPVAQRRDVLLAFGDQRLAAERAGAARRPRRLAGTHDAAALVDPDAGRDVDELEHRAHGVVRDR